MMDYVDPIVTRVSVQFYSPWSADLASNPSRRISPSQLATRGYTPLSAIVHHHAKKLLSLLGQVPSICTLLFSTRFFRC